MPRFTIVCAGDESYNRAVTLVFLGRFPGAMEPLMAEKREVLLNLNQAHVGEGGSFLEALLGVDT